MKPVLKCRSAVLEDGEATLRFDISEKCQTPVAVGSRDVIRAGTDGRVLVACDTALENTMPLLATRLSLNGDVGKT